MPRPLVTTVLLAATSPAPELRAAPAPAPAAERARPSPTAATPAQNAAAPAPAAASCHRLSWNYPRFRLWQYVSSGVVSIGGAALEQFVEFPDTRWRGPILFDEFFRDTLRPDSESARTRAQKISDHMWTATQYYTVFIDSLLVPLAFDRGNTDVAWQMSMLNWQVIGLSFLLTRTAHFTAGRGRPSQEGCSQEPDAAFPCEEEGPSFFSGHTSMSAAGAGLACAHHAALPLYGGGFADTATCVVLAASTLTLGGLRVVGDKHWASDVLIGGVIGGAVGFGLPWLLHYSSPEPAALGAGFLPAHVAIVPIVDESTMGIGLAGWL